MKKKRDIDPEWVSAFLVSVAKTKKNILETVEIVELRKHH